VQISYGGQFFWLKRHHFSLPSLALKPSGIYREKLFYYSGVTAEDFHLASLFSCGMNRRHRTTFNCSLIIKNPYAAVNLVSKKEKAAKRLSQLAFCLLQHLLLSSYCFILIIKSAPSTPADRY
jgi:hypothetical protein